MTIFKIVIPKKVAKQIKKVPLIHRSKICKTIAFLASDPYLGKKLTGDLKDKRSIRIWPSVTHHRGAYS